MAGSNFPGGFKGGVTIRGVPVDIPHPGEVFWVNNSGVLAKGGVGGSDGNDGSYRRPFSTLDYAIGRCTADRGDVIYVMPGHSETYTGAAAIDFDVNGITVIGLGRGSKQPKFLANHANATIEVNADNVTLYNLHFQAMITSVAVGINVLTGSTDCLVSNCLIDTLVLGTDEYTIPLRFAAGCDRFCVEDTTIDMGLAAAQVGVQSVGPTARGDIRRNRIVGDYSLAAVSGITDVTTELYIEDNTLFNGTSGGIGTVAVIVLVNASTGVTARNVIVTDLATQAASMTGSGRISSFNQHSDEAGVGITTSNTSATIVISADGN